MQDSIILRKGHEYTNLWPAEHISPHVLVPLSDQLSSKNPFKKKKKKKSPLKWDFFFEGQELSEQKSGKSGKFTEFQKIKHAFTDNASLIFITKGELVSIVTKLLSKM